MESELLRQKKLFDWKNSPGEKPPLKHTDFENLPKFPPSFPFSGIFMKKPLLGMQWLSVKLNEEGGMNAVSCSV